MTILKFTIYFPLPFFLPFEDGQAFASGFNIDNEHRDFKLTFSQSEAIVKRPPDFSEENHKLTMAKIDLIVSPDIDTSSDGMKKVFSLTLRYLNSILIAIRQTFNANHIYDLTIANLPETLHIIVDDNKHYLYSTYIDNELLNISRITSDHVGKILKIMNQRERYSEELAADDFFENAKTLLTQERFALAIIQFQTSFEVFIRNTYKLILIKNKTKKAEMGRLLSNDRLKDVITKHLSHLLNVDLSYNKLGVMKDWNQKLYKLRNRIVHAGDYNITRKQALDAQYAYINARNFIADCLVSKGYLEKNRMVNLTSFKPQKADLELERKINQRLYEQGFLPKGEPIKLIGAE